MCYNTLYNMVKDCIFTYDTRSYVYHSDTTDFEDDRVSNLTFEYSKIVKKSKVYKKSRHRKFRCDPNHIDRISSQDKSKDMYDFILAHSQSRNREETRKYCNQQYKTQQTAELMKRLNSPQHIIKPLPSTVYKWLNNNLTHISIRNENQVEQYYNIGKTYSHKHSQSKKSDNAKQIQERRKKVLANQIQPKYFKSSNSLRFSSDSDGKINVNKRYIQKKLQENIEKEIKLLNKKGERNIKSQDSQKEECRLFSNSVQYSCLMNACSTPKNNSSLKNNAEKCSSFSSMPSSSSFWNFVFNKLQNTYLPKKQCYCNRSSCQNSKTVKSLAEPSTSCKCISLPPVPTKSCPCNTSQHSYTNPQTKFPENKYQSDKILNVSPKKTHVECQCLLSRVSKDEETASSSKTHIKDKESCQIPHDSLKNFLTKKYNKEIICIHNPQCIMINGCLNFPEKRENSKAGCPTTTIKESFDNIFRKKDNTGNIAEQSQFQVFEQNCKFGQNCKFRPFDGNVQKKPGRVDKSVEMEKCEVADKSSQCTSMIVNAHLVSCELRRISHKSRYESKEAFCSLKPLHYHLHTNKAIADQSIKENQELTKDEIDKSKLAKDTAGIQEQLESKQCLHHNPCIKMPMCLAKLYAESYIGDGILDCMHTPLCEKIPVCYSKPAKMVSVYVQHPNLSRIS